MRSTFLADFLSGDAVLLTADTVLYSRSLELIYLIELCPTD